MLAHAGMLFCEVLRDLPVPTDLEYPRNVFIPMCHLHFPGTDVAAPPEHPPGPRTVLMVCLRYIKSMHYQENTSWQGLFR